MQAIGDVCESLFLVSPFLYLDGGRCPFLFPLSIFSTFFSMMTEELSWALEER